MPKEVVAGLFTVEQGMAYPARYDMEHYDDTFPIDVIKVAHPVASAFEIARIHWGEQAGTFTPYASGAHNVNYPDVVKEEDAPEPIAP